MVEVLLFNVDVYIIDWIDVCMVLVQDGKFDLDDYIDYIILIFYFFGLDVYVFGVCQLLVLVLVVVVVMEEWEDFYVLVIMMLMGGLIDMCVVLIVVNDLVVFKGIEWFKNNVIMKVLFLYLGFMCDVYFGFLQLLGFMGMNFDWYLIVYKEFFQYLVEGDGDSVEKYCEFYDEYFVVMDLMVEFYLQMVEMVFIDYFLFNGIMMYNGNLVDCFKIIWIVLLMVEGEKDDIIGCGQIQVVYVLCIDLLDEKKVYYEQLNVGYYGVFNGFCWWVEIVLCVMDFICFNCICVIVGSILVKFLKLVCVVVKFIGKFLFCFVLFEEILFVKLKGVVDDLKVIIGVGFKLEIILNEVGIFYYW